MAALTSNVLTQLDWAKRLDPNGSTSAVAEILSKSSPMVRDMLWKEGNLPTGHRAAIRTGLPSATWRRFNQGVPRAKSTSAQIDFGMGMLEIYSEVDKSLADLNGNTAPFRLSEAKAFIEGMTQQMEDQVLYGTVSNPAAFMGIAPQLSTMVAANANSAVNVIDGGGSSTDNTSIYLVGWGGETVFGIFPKGSKAGLQHQDLGEQTLLDQTDSTRQFQGYRDHYKWDAGLVVKDWRFIARAANIDVSDLAGSSPANVARLFTRLIYKLPSLAGSMVDEGGETGETFSGVKPIFYANRAVLTWASIQAQEKTNMGFTTTKSAQGGPVTEFWGIPIHLSDHILNTEAEVPGP